MMVSFFTGWNLFLMLGLFVLLYFAGLIAVVKIRKLITMVKYKNYNVDPDRKEADKIIKNVKNDFLLDLENDEK